MRFMMINLLLVCLLLFGIAYLAFGSVETDPNPEPNAHASIHYADDLFGRGLLERSGNFTKSSDSRVLNFKEHVVCLSFWSNKQRFDT